MHAIFISLLLFSLATLTGAQTLDLARGKVVKASSIQSEGGPANYVPEFAVDGKANTRWGSEYRENQWIQVDLLATYRISRMVLKWEDANPKDYRLEISADAVTWEVLATLTGKPMGERTDDVPIESPLIGRYVRMYGVARNQSKLYLPLIEYNGYSLWNYEVYGTPAAATALARDAGEPRQSRLPVNSISRVGWSAGFYSLLGRFLDGSAP